MWGRFAREGNPESAVFFFTCSGARPLREAGASDAASKSRLPPPFLASLRAFVRAGALRAYVFPVLPLRAYVRTYMRDRACPRPGRTHARASVRTYVHCMRAHSREGEKAPSQYVRTYARTCAYVRACPRRSLLHAVCARTYARAQFLWAPAPPPPAQRGTAPHDSHPNLFVSRPSPRTHSDRRSARRCGSSCHALWAVRTHVRTCVYVCARVAPAYARAPGPGRDVALSLRTPVYVRKYVRTYVALHPTLHARACVRT